MALLTEELRTFHIDHNNWVVGRTLQELDPASCDITVLALRRAGIRVPELNMDTAFRPHDILVLAGSPQALDAFQAHLQVKIRPSMPTEDRQQSQGSGTTQASGPDTQNAVSSSALIVSCLYDGEHKTRSSGVSTPARILTILFD